MDTNVDEYIILYAQHTKYMFLPHLWPSSGRCITEDIKQKFWINAEI